MPRRTLVIHLIAGAPRMGIWCDECQTSARFEVDYYNLTDEGPHQMGTIRHCVRCDDDA